MKKFKSLFVLLLILLIFTSCTTTNQTMYKKNNQKEEILTNSNLKFYFPTFFVYDYESKKMKSVKGDGMVIILPDGQNIVIDTLDSLGGNQFVKFLKDLNIETINHLIISHYHGDHCGNVPILFNKFNVENFYHNGIPFSNSISDQIQNILKTTKANIITLKKGDKIIFNENATKLYLDVLWPDFSEKEKNEVIYNPGNTEKKKNLSSLVFKVTYGNFSILFTGDVYKKGDKLISKEYKGFLKSDIIKAPHHGEFYTANSFKLINAVRPDFAIIQDTRYINPIISNIYKAFGSKIIYLKKDGYTLIESNGITYTLNQYELD